MELTCPEETSGRPTHPIPEDIVEEAVSEVEGVEPEALHDLLETVQSALERKLASRELFVPDGMLIFGRVAHEMSPANESDPYARHLHLEDGRHQVEDEHLLAHRFAAEYGPVESDESSERWTDASTGSSSATGEIEPDTGESPSVAGAVDPGNRERLREISAVHRNLDEYTPQQRRAVTPLTYGIWIAVADLLDADEDAPGVAALREAHQRTFYGHCETTDYGTTGFVVGVPELFDSGTISERQLFRWFAKQEALSPVVAMDAYGPRTTATDGAYWHSVRGVDKDTFKTHRARAVETLGKDFDPETLPAYIAAPGVGCPSTEQHRVRGSMIADGRSDFPTEQYE